MIGGLLKTTFKTRFIKLKNQYKKRYSMKDKIDDHILSAQKQIVKELTYSQLSGERICSLSDKINNDIKILQESHDFQTDYQQECAREIRHILWTSQLNLHNMKHTVDVNLLFDKCIGFLQNEEPFNKNTFYENKLYILHNANKLSNDRRQKLSILDFNTDNVRTQNIIIAAYVVCVIDRIGSCSYLEYVSIRNLLVQNMNVLMHNQDISIQRAIKTTQLITKNDGSTVLATLIVAFPFFSALFSIIWAYYK